MRLTCGVRPLLLAGLLCGSLPLSSENYHFNHHWSVLGEFVYMRRSEIHNHTIVKDANKTQCDNRCPNFEVMNSKQLVNDFEYEPGYRVGLSYMPNPRLSLEGNFLWVSEWTARKVDHGDQSLSFPFKNVDFVQDFANASEAIGVYKSNFWDAELNYWDHFTPRNVDYFALSGIAGLRYFHLYETFQITMVKPPDRSTYHLHTKNHIGAIQVGLDLQVNPMRWLTWDVLAKVGFMVDWTKTNSVVRDSNNQVKLSEGEKHKTQVGVFADVAAQIGFNLASWLNIHLGYDMIFFSGLALAPEQINKKSNTTKHRTDGTAIIHGLYTGFTVSF